MRRVWTAVSILFCLVALSARAAHTRATLVLSDDTAKPGDTVWAGVDLKMEPEWHTYWKNSGDAGMPTTIAWQLPAGVTAGEIHWPLPEKLPPAEVTTYGYNDETMLLVPLKIAANVPPGPIMLTANLTWLECKDVCIPQKATVQAALNIGSETKPSAEAPDIIKWQGKVPGPAGSFQVSAGWEKAANGDTRPLIINALQVTEQLLPVEQADFFPDAADNYEILPATGTIGISPSIRLRKNVKLFSGGWPKEISGVLVVNGKFQRLGFDVQFPIANEAPTGATTSAPASTEVSTPATTIPAGQDVGAASSGSLGRFLLYGFIGGLILNVMPCVLPVIALKILGFVSEARSEPRRVRNLGFIYAAGVLASFAALALIFIGLKALGHQVGWGIQFGSPVFVVGLTVLTMLIALNLFGVFEVTPSGRIMNAAGTLASKHGAAGAFFNGFLATVLAASCTAPILGTAVAFALPKGASEIFLIFLFVGIGLAAPYVILSCNPALLKFLPKPGAWMEKFKIAIGFPMLATTVWLFNVAASDYGSRVLWLGMFLVVVALAAWVFGEFIQRGRSGKGIAAAVILILLIGGGYFSLAETSSKDLVWEAWSPEAVAQARSAGRPVLVDFTATWCVTCNAIVKPALENPAVTAKLKDINAATLIGDYTRTPSQMTEEISNYGSSGVPLVLVFPKNPNAQAIVLRQPDPFELPSSYSKAVLAALDQAD
ncbi:MAG TPA: protein-disulfide reductase DsbD domain-containing protein [Verrucomicrobiae bacterium]|nr:protein-disulfide reductase DsbD domain-containing protein [Verrucomicrobiae bacterium]